MSHRQLTWATLVAASTPSILPGPWQNMNCHPAFRCLPDAPRREALLQELDRDYSRAELAELGWVAPESIDPQQPLRLHPALVAVPDFVMAIESAADAPVTELYTGHPWAGAVTPGLTAPLRDYRMPRGESSPGETPPLYVVFSMRDLACLWSVGRPAILGTTLATASKRDVEHLIADWERIHAVGQPVAPGSNVPEAELSIRGAALRLVLLDFDLALLHVESQPQVEKVARHLLQLCRCCDIELELDRWQPTASDVNDLRFAIEHGDVEDIAACIGASTETASRALETALPSGDSLAAVEPLPTYAEALQGYEVAQRQHLGAQQLERKWQAQRDAWQREIGAPLMEMAAQESNPLIKGFGTTLAELYGSLQLLQHPSPDERGSNSSGEHSVMSPEGTKREKHLIAMIIELCARIHACQHSTHRPRLFAPSHPLSQRMPRMIVNQGPLLPSATPKRPSPGSASMPQR